MPNLLMIMQLNNQSYSTEGAIVMVKEKMYESKYNNKETIHFRQNTCI